MLSMRPNEPNLSAVVASRNQQPEEFVACRQDWGPARQAAHEAFEELYRRHARRLLAFLAARVQRGELDEVHQAVWLRVWERLSSPAGILGSRDSGFSAWLYQFARRHLRARSRAQRGLPRAGQADTCWREIEDHLRLPQEKCGGCPHFLEANAALTKQITDSAQAEQRLTAEHAVARVLAESTRLIEAAPKILQTIAHSLAWDVGVLWVLDREPEALRCIDVWHAPGVAIPAFEQCIRQGRLSRGVDLPSRVWAREHPVWVCDLTRDPGFQEAALAAREGLRAAVGFPVHNGTEFLGVMAFFSREMRPADQELLRMMASIGSHVAQFMVRRRAERALFLKEAELGIAKRVQQGLAPKCAPALAGFEIAGISHCADETGGDYFDFFPLLDGCQGVVVADASGHGLGPALLITAARAYLRAFALAHQDLDCILARVNRCLTADVRSGDFVTLLLARLDPQTRSLFHASAGHTPGFLFDASGQVKRRLESTGLPLGIVADGEFPLAPTIALEAGDLVLLITDGVVEACAPDGTAFGYQRAIDLVRCFRRDPAAQIAYNLYHGVRAFSHNLSQVDDITVVVIKVREVA
jgi:serine phosphatase RsbU (regulator of sigma subunit)/DNA-directed RNA polymerase specialized sigma24 family protein